MKLKPNKILTAVLVGLVVWELMRYARVTDNTSFFREIAAIGVPLAAVLIGYDMWRARRRRSSQSEEPSPEEGRSDLDRDPSAHDRDAR